MWLRTLGGLVLEGGTLGRPKPLLLLAYLAIEGPKSRRELAELFFGDVQDPRDSLSTALRHLRHSPYGLLSIKKNEVGTDIACDANQLLDLLNAGRAEDALPLYRGAFLKGSDLSLGEELEEWVYDTREYLAERLRGALLLLAEGAANEGNIYEAVRYAERAYILDGARVLDPDDFARVYHLLQLGNSPRASHLRQEASALEIPLNDVRGTGQTEPTASRVPQPRHNLPSQLTSFIGRDLELLEIARVLAQPDGRLLTLHGPGGIGKTRLAIQAAFEQLQGNSFVDGIFFIPLDTVASREQLPTRIADVLELALQGTRTPWNELERHVGTKHSLLILDNFEHLAAAASNFTRWLSACPNLCLIVTSRERLNLKVEWVLPVEGLPVPDNDADLERAQQVDALNLFVRRAKRAHLTFSLSRSGLPDALEICRLVNGLPLGLELAATWVRFMPLRDIVTELSSNLSLVTPLQDAPERQRSLGAAFEHSWKLLTTSEQVVLRKLSIFHGGFRREAAREVAGATLALLARLTDKALLRVSDGGRYNFHALLHEFAAEKLIEHDAERAETALKHARYFARLLEEHGTSKLGPKQKETLKALDEEFANIQLAWTYAVIQHKHPLIEKMADGLGHLVTLKARAAEGIELFTQAEDALAERPEGAEIALARVLKNAAMLYADLGEFEASEDCALRSLRALSTLDLPLERAEAFRHLGIASSRLGKYEAARAAYDRELKIERAQDDRVGMASTLSHLGFLRLKLGHYTRAEALLQESSVIDTELGNYAGVANTFDSLGTLYLLSGRVVEAESAFHKSLATANEIGFRALIPHALIGLAGVKAKQGLLPQATEYVRKAFDFASKHDEKGAMPKLLLVEAGVELLDGRFGAAEALLYRSLTAARHLGATPEILKGFVAVVECWHEQNRSEALAVALLQTVQHHPSAWAETRQRAKSLLRKLGCPLPTDIDTEGPGEGDGPALDEMVDRVLNHMASYG
jgi:predicted ATPase